ncbi:hypothetical protein HNR73_002180 [Phytomonospora endophytica]|uniref:Uncharacterized protein n=1 Tax=Phytomonospora endophytica TaxID=714109 RepID=A0A841FQU0_9ACTN|nr:hypothetical protein [Phytomonospora endophytica]
MAHKLAPPPGSGEGGGRGGCSSFATPVPHAPAGSPGRRVAGSPGRRVAGSPGRRVADARNHPPPGIGLTFARRSREGAAGRTRVAGLSSWAPRPHRRISHLRLGKPRSPAVARAAADPPANRAFATELRRRTSVKSRAASPFRFAVARARRARRPRSASSRLAPCAATPETEPHFRPHEAPASSPHLAAAGGREPGRVRTRGRPAQVPTPHAPSPRASPHPARPVAPSPRTTSPAQTPQSLPQPPPLR